jgi:hypothetical protein
VLVKCIIEKGMQGIIMDKQKNVYMRMTIMSNIMPMITPRTPKMMTNIKQGMNSTRIIASLPKYMAAVL